MKRCAWRAIAVVSLTLTLTAAAAYAQGDKGMRIDIPFAFQVGEERLPAGNYSVGERSLLIVIRSRGGQQGVTVPPHSRLGAGRDRVEAKMVFHRYGAQYFLSEVWPADGQGYQLRRTRSERALAQRSQDRETIAVLAPRQ